MDAKLLQKICQEIYRRYPQVAGRRPRVQAILSPAGKATGQTAAGHPAAGHQAAGRPAHLLVFEGQGLTADRRQITTLLRVVVDRSGKIIKVSSSR